MELLIVILLILILIFQALICWVIICIEKWLSVLCSLEPEEPKEEAKATDPYTKPAEIFSSTSHIVVPKTPTEIRNQNFNKLKEGVEYGDIAKR